MIRVFALVSAAFLLVAPQARADANGYLAYLNDHGTRVYAFDDATKVSYGLHACELLHSGLTPDQAAASPSASDLHGIIDAAQHNLCPDTLH